ncbi:MAG: carbohydrate-binding domain-containing protein [Bacteroidales bacterium]|nr:carbohydrate-binding domain-containing protein [Bacteroidales bacterium]
MKRALYLLLPLALLSGGCTRDEIEVSGSSGSGTTTPTDPELAWNAESFEAILGAGNTYPTLSNPYGVSVTFTSSDEGVATIASDGTVTLVAAGSATITATSASTSTYSSGSASYSLTVIKNTGRISWSATSCTARLDEQNSFPLLSNPGSQTITYASSNTAVATIAANGTVTLVAQGTTTITATAAENETYEAGSASYTLTVEGDLKSAGLSWSAEAITATLASNDNTFPTLSNPNGLAISYSSTDETVATVTQDGTVTPVAAGTTSLIATSAATATYAAGSAHYTLTVVKHEVTLAWSASTCKAVLDESNTFPTLTVTPSDAGLAIQYASSNTSVATIAQDGTVTLVAAGSSTITASFGGDDTYKAVSASYALTVTSGADEGAGTYTFSSTGDTSSDDDISNTTFTRMITVTYASSGATVTGDYYGYASVSGNHVTVNNTGSESIVYQLTGTASDGSFKLYSSKKQALLLNGLTLTNPSGAAINNQSKKRTFVMIEGTNTLADGASYTGTPSGEDEKAAFFSEGQLIFSGSGSLTVTATGKAGITSDDYVRFMSSPTVKVTSSAGHGVRGKDKVEISSGTLDVATSAAMKKGINSDSLVVITGGTTTVKVTGSGGYDSDDKEYKGTSCIKADRYFRMSGGTVTLTNSGAGGKGLRAGSEETTDVIASEISGGTLTITTTGTNYSAGDKSPKGIKAGWKTASSGGGWGGGSSSSASYGNLVISGGTVDVTTSGTGGEGIESKGSLTFSGGKVTAVSAKDDAINAAGIITFGGAYVYAWSSGNDAVDSNYGKSGAITVTGGVVIAHSKNGAEEGFDCDNHGYIIFKGGTVFCSGGQQGGGGGWGSGSSSTPTCSQPVHFLSNYSLGGPGYFTVTDSSSQVVFSVYVPRALSGCYSFITAPDLKSGTTYKYGVTSSAPSGSTSGWGTYYYTGGTASVSTGSWTAGSGYTSSGSSSGGGGRR